MAGRLIAHIFCQGTGVGKHQPFHRLRMSKGDDLGHHAAQGLACQSDLFFQAAEQFCHGVGKLAIVGKLDLIVKGQYGKILRKTGKVFVE